MKKKFVTQSEAKHELAAQQTHRELRSGHGVIVLPSHAEIAMRAYGIYVKDGCKQGRCKENWQQAEHDMGV